MSGHGGKRKGAGRPRRSGSGLWTEARIRADAAQYQSRGDWFKHSCSAYRAAKRLGIFEEIAAPKSQWSEVALYADAAQYRTPREWEIYSQSAYTMASKRGILTDITKDMKRSNRGFHPGKPAILYYYEIGGLYKLGITNRTLRQRVGVQYKDIRVLARKAFLIGADAAAAERAILNFVDDCYRYDGPPVLTRLGDTELFTSDILGLDLAA